MTRSKPWDELHREFRMTVLAERNTGKTMTEVAEEIPVGRSTLFRLMETDSPQPRTAQFQAVESYVESQMGLSDWD